MSLLSAEVWKLWSRDLVRFSFNYFSSSLFLSVIFRDCWLLLRSINVLRVYKRVIFYHGLPWWFSGKESTRQSRRCRFSPWVSKTPWRRKWQPIPVCLPEKFYGQRILVGYNPLRHKSWTWLSDYTTTNQYSIIPSFFIIWNTTIKKLPFISYLVTLSYSSYCKGRLPADDILYFIPGWSPIKSFWHLNLYYVLQIPCS